MDAVIERIEELGKDGVFGGSLKKVSLHSDDGKGSQFASELFFFRVDVQDTDKLNEVPVVVKIEPEDKTRESKFTELQFANEVAMYGTIMPKLGANELGIIPKMIYGLATNGVNPKEDIIIFEDLGPQGFRISKDLFLDFDHLALSMRALGQFHGLSYKIKKSSPETLTSLAKSLKRKSFNDPDNLLPVCLMRGFRELLENPSYPYLERVFEKLTDKPLKETKYKLEAPEEPFAVIVHGDFNNNNLMFAYENDKVRSVKLIDFGTSLYADPAVDVSFFLYMNTSSEMRVAHWDDLLEEYWKGITSIVEDPGFSFQALLKNFAKKAISGFFRCSFFLPFMMAPVEVDFDKMTLEEKREWYETIGGQEATEASTGIVRHLSDKGFMEEFLFSLQNL